MSPTPDKKKPYCRPVVIDLSIEAVTGIGAGTCSDGPEVATAGCGMGSGANTSCSDGSGVNAGCLNGIYPYETAGLCKSGLTTSTCHTGSNTTTGSSRCMAGNSAIHTAINDCADGAANSNICGYGNANNPGPSYS